jgi:hypothetical protein
MTILYLIGVYRVSVVDDKSPPDWRLQGVSGGLRKVEGLLNLVFNVLDQVGPSDEASLPKSPTQG